MEARDLIAVWQAVPFRPFRVHLIGGRVVQVGAPWQVAMPPDGSAFFVPLEAARMDYVHPGMIESIELLDGDPLPLPRGTAGGDESPAVPEAEQAADTGPVPEAGHPDPSGDDETTWDAPVPDPGEVVLFARTAVDGRRLVGAVVKARDGHVMLTTAGTRWDMAGLESHANARRLHLVHADDVELFREVLLWPPDTASFEGFSEATPCAAAQRGLLELDDAARARPREASAEAGYDPVTVEPLDARGAPRASPGAEGSAVRVADSRDAKPALTYDVRVSSTEVAPHQFRDTPSLVAPSGQAVFDLEHSGWFGECAPAGGAYRFDLSRHSGDAAIVATIWPASGRARIDGLDVDLPLRWLHRQLVNYVHHERWSGLIDALRAFPPVTGAPEVVVTPSAGWRVEFHPPEVGVTFPHFQARVIGPHGRCLLDLRGTRWALSLDLGENGHEEPAGHRPWRFRLFERDDPTRHEGTRWLAMDPESQRVGWSRATNGTVPLEVLNALARRCPVTSMLVDWLDSALARGLTA